MAAGSASARARLGVLLLILIAIGVTAIVARQAPDRPSASTTAGPAAPIDEPLLEQLRGAARITSRLTSPSQPIRPVRDPFAFEPARAGPQPHATVSASPEVVSLGQPVEVAAPPKLIGIAEHRSSGRETRTAIFDVAGEVFLARIGDRVSTFFRVEAIGPDAVSILDVRSGGGHVLSLD